MVLSEELGKFIHLFLWLYKLNDIIENIPIEKVRTQMKIFISHASKNKETIFEEKNTMRVNSARYHQVSGIIKFLQEVLFVIERIKQAGI